jgi:predicted NAD/FAD-binding protein
LQLLDSGEWQHFDAIIMATPPTVSAALLKPAASSSSSSGSSSNDDGGSSGLSFSRVLQGFKSEASKLVLHTDSTTMPADASLWSSVNFLLVPSSLPEASTAAASSAATSRRHSATAYDAQACIWLNAAQKHSTSSMQRQLFQTWNPVTPISPEHILTSSEFQRPLCSIPSVQLLKQLWSHQGAGGVFVCGSYVPISFLHYVFVTV